MTAPATTSRIDYLDAVRAFALLLGIVFHASMSFMPVYIGWAVMDVSTSPIVANGILVSDSFRMALFFLIAGFFSHLAIERKGLRAFVATRMGRIAIPFVVGWILLRPLLVASWVIGAQSLSGAIDIAAAWRIGWNSFLEGPSGWFIGTHLWFLYYLLVVTAGTLTLRAFTPVGWRECAARRVGAIVRSPHAWWMLSLPTAVCLSFMSGWGVDTPDKTLVPHAPALVLYGGFFGFGWVLHREDGLLDRFSRIHPMRIALCVVSVGAAVALAGYQSNPGHPQADAIRFGFHVAYANMMWTLIPLCIGGFRRWFQRPNPVVRYVADASYWMYLVHLPIVVWLQVAVAEAPLHWSIKLVAVSTLTIGLSLLLYDGFVRSTWLGRLLNGRKAPRAIFRGTPKRCGDETPVQYPVGSGR